MERLLLVSAVSALVVYMFRINLQMARRYLRPMMDDERMDLDGQITDRVLFQKTIAYAFQQTLHTKRWMIEVGKVVGFVIVFEFWHFYSVWQTYLFLIPISGYGFLFWVAGKHIAIVEQRIERLPEDDQVAVAQLLVKVRREQ